ncbi:hypothetical protein HPB50_003897 [Hyalomma asiaticum]|uniref:Uncharacterized protein n=1 Tax=Hyalomma asiaticum TaxID=266040 RepID=A0ACB7T3B1_HYAAI|nr:hypothetical protein HPB50_003897 [Hyalomma asiaticum]
MGILLLDGEGISPKGIRSGLMYGRNKKRKMPIESTDRAVQAAALVNEKTYSIRRAARNIAILSMTSKKPNLPADDIEIIVRPETASLSRQTVRLG